MTTGTLRRRRTGSGRGGPVTEAPGRAARTPDSLLRGPVSTALTLAGPTSVRPAGIVGILRFFTGVQSRFGVNVSTMDTHTPSCLAPKPPSPPGPPACPGVSARASVSEVMTPTCLPREETAHERHHP